MKHAKVLLLILSVIILSNWLFTEVDFPDVDYKVLKGIDGFEILIEVLNEDAIKIGLTRKRLKTVTELALRREGITVVEYKGGVKTTEELLKFSRTPFIYVNVNVSGRAFSVKLELKERVVLERDESISCTATTWDQLITGIHGGNSEFIVSALKELLDYFINDYYKANPKKR